MKAIKKSWFAMSVLIALGLSSIACAQKKYGDDYENNVNRPHIKSNLENVSYFLAVTKDGKYVAFNKKGSPVSSCQICTRELEAKLEDKFCQMAIKEGKEIGGKKICKALTGATIQDVGSITTLKSHINPYCDILVIDGFAFPFGDGCL